MKRRSFLSLLGLAPAAPLIAREIVKAEPVAVPPPMPERIVGYEPSDTGWAMCTLGPEPVLQHHYDTRLTFVDVTSLPSNWEGWR
jgi:hypothetical protein